MLGSLLGAVAERTRPGRGSNAAVQLVIGRRVDAEDRAATLAKRAVGVPEKRPAAEGDDGALRRGRDDGRKDIRLDFAERRLAARGEYLRNRPPLPRDDRRVEVDELRAKSFGQRLSQRRLAARRRTVYVYVSTVHAI